MIFSCILYIGDWPVVTKIIFITSIKNRVTLAVFKSSGKITYSKDSLKICSKGLLKDSKQLLTTLKLISSILGLLFVSREKNASFNSFILKGYSTFLKETLNVLTAFQFHWQVLVQFP